MVRQFYVAFGVAAVLLLLLLLLLLRVAACWLHLHPAAAADVAPSPASNTFVLGFCVLIAKR